MTREDVEFLLPRYANPLEDPALVVPPLGRPIDEEVVDEPPKAFEADLELGREVRVAAWGNGLGLGLGSAACTRSGNNPGP